LLSIEHVSKTFNGRAVIQNLSLKIEKGKISVLVGPSGCGKSTILNLIAGIEEKDTGTIRWTEDIPDKIGYVFQEDRLLPWFTVLQNIKAVNPSGSDERAKYFLKTVGLEGFENFFPSELSGGMRQRCAIARALFYGSDFLLMDEPFTSLDYVIRQKMIADTAKICREEGITILFVTHDLEEAMKIAHRIFVLKKNPCCLEESFEIGECNCLSQDKHCEVKHKILKMIEEGCDL